MNEEMGDRADETHVDEMGEKYVKCLSDVMYE